MIYYNYTIILDGDISLSIHVKSWMYVDLFTCASYTKLLSFPQCRTEIRIFSIDTFSYLIPTDSDLYNFVPVQSSVYQFVQVCTGLYKFAQVSTGLHQSFLILFSLIFFIILIRRVHTNFFVVLL